MSVDLPKVPSGLQCLEPSEYLKSVKSQVRAFAGFRSAVKTINVRCLFKKTKPFGLQ